MRHIWEWEPWEARRASLPRRPEPDVREAREDARLLVMVVRARLADGPTPFEHAEALGRVAEDQRVKVRQRRVAAGLLGRLRLAGMARVATGVENRGKPTRAPKGSESRVDPTARRKREVVGENGGSGAV